MPISCMFYLCFYLVTANKSWIRFITEMDSAKSGLRLKKDAFTADIEKYDYRKPACMLKKDEVQDSNSNGRLATRPTHLGPFILDILTEEGKKLRDDLMKDLTAQMDSISRMHDRDRDLSHLLWPALASSPDFAPDLEKIRWHVLPLIEECKRLGGETEGQSVLSSKASHGQKKVSDNKWVELAKKYAQGPEGVSKLLADTRQVELLKASCAVELASPTSKFPFMVAFAALCRLKAEAKGLAPIARHFADRMTIQSSITRCLRGRVEAEQE
jgi:RNA-dependent RNA polymerase